MTSIFSDFPFDAFFMFRFYISFVWVKKTPKLNVLEQEVGD
jgi:hypothetical protein